MSHRSPVLLWGPILVVLALAGCKARGLWAGKADLEAQWNFEGVQSLVFANQQWEREFSSLATDAESLYLISERTGKLLRIAFPVGTRSEFEEKTLWRRKGGEYEGAALQAGRLYLVDEHADRAENASPSVVAISPQTPAEPLSVWPIRWAGLDCDGGRCLEGIAVVGQTVYLLDERDPLEPDRCASRLYVTTLKALEGGAAAPQRTIELALPDCNWRYSDLHAASLGERTYLLALRTYCVWSAENESCDENAYVVEILDPAATPPVISSYRFPEATVQWWRMANVSRNLEGIALGPDGALYLVSDNRWVHGRQPKTLLLRIPRR
jgi:hypothetical protein